MKKVYAGSELAAVVLDSPEEIRLVEIALGYALPMASWTSNDRTAIVALRSEIQAPAP